ncbi:MAG TPA: FHIPEP family type III secretion protein, partial [Thiolinea sp.]|nr:FHIPEP family type III secretion protein [Thiolinea sp.]
FFKELGVPLDGISISISSHQPSDDYQVSIHGIPVGKGQLGTNTNQRQEQDVIQADNNSLLVTPARNQDLTPIQVLTRHINYILHRHASEFIGIQEVHSLMGKLEGAGYATLVQEAQRAAPNPRIADILKRLLNEGVSIRDLRRILGTIVEFGEAEKDNGMLTERVRISMKRQLSYTFTNGTGKLPVYMLDPESEKLLQTSIRQTPAGIHMALPPDVSRRLSENLRSLEEQHAQNPAPGAPRPVVLTSLDLRRHIRNHLTAEFPQLPILSLPELTPNVAVQPVGEIRLLAPPTTG